MLFVVFSLFLSFNLYAQSFDEGEYYNFPLTNKLKENLLKSDTLSFDISNSTKENKEFYLVFEDNKSSDYWSKLNFKTTLFPGPNHLSFNLQRLLGERGSTRYFRKLNFKKLTKMFVVVNPDKAGVGKFKITNIKYIKQKDLLLPKYAWAFNFQGASVGQRSEKIFTTVTEKDFYRTKKGYGFDKIDLWQKHNSHIAPEHLNYVLNVHQASFKVKLAPGEYHLRLIWDELGYWDVPFWRKREFRVNGKMALKQKRDVDDFLQNLFRFWKEPKVNSSPYSLYFKKIFYPYDYSFKHKGGIAHFDFNGDTSAVALNNLYLWPKSQDKKMKVFFKSLDHYSQKRFNEHFRQKKSTQNSVKHLRVRKVSLSDSFRPFKNCQSDEVVEEVFTNNSLKNIHLCVSSHSKEKIQIKLTDFFSGKNKISADAFYLKTFRYQFESLDLNHQTYQLSANRVTPSSFEIDLKDFQTRYVSLSFFGGSYLPGSYQGRIILKQGKKEYSKKIVINIIKRKFEKIPLHTGVIGLNPFPYTYFQDSKIEILKEKSYFKALELLQEIGLDLFTDIPAPYVRYHSPANEYFSLETKSTLEFLKKAKTKTVYFYNGAFPKNFFGQSERNAAQSEKDFEKNMIQELEKLRLKSSKDFVYLYSDEATGYRNAVDSDRKLITFYKKHFPSLKLGGFGNLYNWDKGKDLYQNWDFALYSDIPSKSLFAKVKKANANYGVYNLCAWPGADLTFCFGVQLYRLYKAGVKNYFEWHAAAIHNYPYLDLDGREADIGLFYPLANGDVGVTKRYMMASAGLEVLSKLLLLEDYLNKRKALGHEEIKAKKWLDEIKRKEIFPIKGFYENNQHRNKTWMKELNAYLKTFFI